MKNLINTLILAILAGILIGFGGTIYLSCESKVIGSFLFSFGLATIICQGFALYTGRVGYYPKFDFTNLCLTIIGNFLGTYLIAKSILLTRLDLSTKAQTLISVKLHDTPLSFLILSIGCGAMMFLAVDNFKQSKAWFFVIMPIMIFILSGFEHSIANMFYFSLANEWTWLTICLTIIALIGNAIGAFLVNKTKLLIQENND